MKKYFVIACVLVLTAAMLTACRNGNGNVGTSTGVPTTTARVTTTPTAASETTGMATTTPNTSAPGVTGNATTPTTDNTVGMGTEGNGNNGNNGDNQNDIGSTPSGTDNAGEARSRGIRS